MEQDHYYGMQIYQRGYTYYLTRVNGIRNTTGYGQFTYCLWHLDQTTKLEDNPNVSYRLFRQNWKDWVAVTLDT